MRQFLNRTKIITTIGPATNSFAAIESLYEVGMTTIRLNMSHGNHQEHLQRMQWAREVAVKIKYPISIMLDTKGPEIRIGKMQTAYVVYQANDVIHIKSSLANYENIFCDEKTLTMSHDISQDIEKGQQILVDDGKLTLIAQKVTPGLVEALVFNTYKLQPNKRVNLPGVALTLAFLSKQDRADIVFGLKNNIDYIAASFVNSASDVAEIKALLQEHHCEHVQIISKIESQLGLNNIDEIIEISDGIMFARGDLGLEIPYYDVPYWEKIVIRKCRNKAKLSIVATQMLESMTTNPHPTRAEVTDVYFATELGADATMLSGESANGDFPIIAVSTMTHINQRAEKEFYSKIYYAKQLEIARENTSNSQRGRIALNLAEKAKDGDYRFAVVLSNTGYLLRMISKFRPNIDIISVTADLGLYTTYGVWNSIHMSLVTSTIDYKENPQLAIAKAVEFGARSGDKILFVHSEKLLEFTVE